MGRHIIGRIIVFSVNFALWLSGILLIVFGSIGVADKGATENLLNHIDGVNNVSNIIDITDYVQGVAIFMIVLGSFLFLLGGNGCHGIMRKNKRSILSYSILLLGAILIEIALIIYASVYPSSEKSYIQEQMKESLNSSFKASVSIKLDGSLQFSTDQTEKSWQELEFETTCCGASGYMDYKQFGSIPIRLQNGTFITSEIPLSCCVLKKPGRIPNVSSDIANLEGCISQASESVYIADGCWNTVHDMIWQFDLIAIILSSCLIAAQLLGAIFAGRLWKDTD